MNDLIDRQTAIQIALEFTVEYLGGAFDEDLQKKLVERMNGVPVVDAIPIEWIEEYIRTHPASTDIYFKWMIDEWKEEQEETNGRK